MRIKLNIMGTLLLAIALLVTACGAIGYVIDWLWGYRPAGQRNKQSAAISRIQSRGGKVTPLLAGDRFPEVAGIFRVCAVDFSHADITDDDLLLLDGLGASVDLILTNASVTDSAIESLLALHSSHINSLSLSGTKITDKALQRLHGLPDLTGLDLSHTSITDTGIKSLLPLASLLTLRVSATRIGDEGLRHIGKSFGASQLKWLELDLSGTAITDEGLPRLLGLRFDKLDLSNTRITDRGLLLLQDTESIRELYLANTQITDQGVEHLTVVNRLCTLSLADTRVGRLGVSKLRALTALGRLDLSGTKIDDDSLQDLAHGSFDVLWLRRTNVTDAGIEPLTRMLKLRYVYLSGSRITAAGVLALRRARPTLQIMIDP